MIDFLEQVHALFNISPIVLCAVVVVTACVQIARLPATVDLESEFVSAIHT